MLLRSVHGPRAAPRDIAPRSRQRHLRFGPIAPCADEVGKHRSVTLDVGDARNVGAPTGALGCGEQADAGGHRGPRAPATAQRSYDSTSATGRTGIGGASAAARPTQMMFTSTKASGTASIRLISASAARNGV